MRIYRHGDILFKQIDNLPKSLVKKADRIVAYGEATGHKHQFLDEGVSVWLLNGEISHITADAIAPITHEEHKRIDILPGNYEIIHEREYDYFEEEISKVID